MRALGYARPLFAEDDPRSDVPELKALGATEIFIEQAHDHRSVRGDLLATMSSGDALIVTSLERLEPRLPDLIRLLLDLDDRNVRIVCPQAPSISEGSADVAGVLRELGAFQEKLVSARLRASLRDSPARVGRPPKIDGEKLTRAIQMRSEGASYREIGEALGVSVPAVSRAIARGSGH